MDRRIHRLFAQIDVSKLRRLALDTDGEANDGGETGSGQAEAPEACDVEFTEILGRWGDDSWLRCRSSFRTAAIFLGGNLLEIRVGKFLQLERLPKAANHSNYRNPCLLD